MDALSVAVDVARRLTPEAIETAVVAARESDDARFTGWREAGLWGGYAGLAAMAAAFDAAEPESGWDEIGFDYLRRAVHGMEAVQSPTFGLSGLAGLASGAALLSRDGSRYETLLARLDAAIVQRVEQASTGILRSRPHGVPVMLFDVIAGLAGAGRYLLDRTKSEPYGRALESLLKALVYLSEEDDEGIPHWHTPLRDSTENLRGLYPHGHVNLGLSHGVPGPLALLSLAASQGFEIAGQREAIIRVANRIVQARCKDEWGTGFPAAVSKSALREDGTSTHAQGTGAVTAVRTARSAWCYGPPGVARALWLAGTATGRTEYSDLAIAAMEAVFMRPVPARRIDSPTLCHGVSGLLQIALRFERDGAGNVFSTAARDLTVQLLQDHEPDSLFGFRDRQPGGRRIDNPGLLEGAAGVALALLTASTPAEPVWDRILMLS